ncbi:MAG TPA: DUF3606 domain-containing protein [Burkholderiales bacterium]|nr:DUF3606 domain-containing protein [Burkholderiales bacterium]
MNIELMLAAVLYLCLGLLLMYGSVRGNAPFICESRRSVVLLEAARKEAESNRRRERAKRPVDKNVICLRDDWERLWWSDHLGVSPAALEAAVREVGPTATEIKRYLRRAARERSHAHTYA